MRCLGIVGSGYAQIEDIGDLEDHIKCRDSNIHSCTPIAIIYPINT